MNMESMGSVNENPLASQENLCSMELDDVGFCEHGTELSGSIQ
jgi:hypothetical protein